MTHAGEASSAAALTARVRITESGREALAASVGPQR
jgi:hypothetical protein